MLRQVFGALGVCATLLAVAAAAQARPGDDAAAEYDTAADAEGANPHEALPLGNPGEWITTHDFPREALREKVSGATRVRLDIDEKGVPTRCAIIQASGSELLDAATCNKLIERARFHPVLDGARIAVPGYFETSVRWAAVEPAPDPLATTPQPIDTSLWVSLSNLEFDPAEQGDRTAAYDLRVDAIGGVTDCAITRGSGDEQFDKSLCNQLEVNAAFDVSSSGPGIFSGSYTQTDHNMRAFPSIGRSNPRTRNYGITVFIEDDGSISDCRWIGRSAPSLDPWPHCNRSSWVDQRDFDGELVRGAVQLLIDQRQLEKVSNSDGRSADRGLTIVFREDSTISDCHWNGANPPALDPLLACNFVAGSMRKHTGLAALMRGTQNVTLDEHEVEALLAEASGLTNKQPVGDNLRE